MNRMMTTMLAFGAGMAAYNMVQRTDLISNRQMKKWTKQIKKTFF